MLPAWQFNVWVFFPDYCFVVLLNGWEGPALKESKGRAGSYRPAPVTVM